MEKSNSPWDTLSREQIVEVRNRALQEDQFAMFSMYGYTFVMPVALFEANAKLMSSNFDNAQAKILTNARN